MRPTLVFLLLPGFLFGCTEPPAVDTPTPITAPSSASSFRASGNEPGWRLELGDRETRLTLDNGARTLIAATR